jgi:AraC-like DNA-binding protein
LKALKEIRFFKEINELYEATNSRHRAVWNLFDIFRLEDLEVESVKALPPYRKGFYHVSFKISPSNSSVFINADRFENRRDCLVFSSPYHIYSWQRDSNTKGFVFYFKDEFLACDILSEFPFFKVTESNLFEPEQAEAEKLLGYFQMIWAEFRGANSYKNHITHSLVLALLYYCKSLYERYRTQEKDQPRSLIILNQYQQLINKFYLHKKTVEEYASLLGITPNHLNDVIKQSTGKTARSFIVERILLEAKSLLTHTQLDIADISHNLQFDEPTNFSKFFKKYVGLTPLQFRNGNPLKD